MSQVRPALPPASWLFLSLLAAAGLCAPRGAAANDPPQLKPMKVAPAAEAGKLAKAAADEHGAVAPAGPAAPVDPLEQLRLRLAAKLAGGKVTEVGGPYDLRVVARTASAPAAAQAVAHPTRTAGHGKAAAAAASAAPAHAANAHWSYQGPAGPQTWGGLKPEFTLCSSGQRQSPIDIRGGLAVDLDPVKFNYQASPFAVIDNGHTVQANLAQGNSIEIGGKRFELVQFHFHRPSEERIDGRQFELSVHLVHKDDQGRLAVVAVLMDRGSPQPVVQKVWNNLPLEKGEELSARVALDLNELLPADRRYFTYMGSLTTPPCSEGVQWVVMRQPLTMSPEQIELFARIYPMNSRPVQQASGRRILQSQ
jgi:carbonic anhydrase